MSKEDNSENKDSNKKSGGIRVVTPDSLKDVVVKWAPRSRKNSSKVD